MVKPTPVKAGELLYFTSGDYSSYGLDYIARALKDFVIEDFKHKPSRTLIVEGYVEELPAREIHEQDLW